MSQHSSFVRKIAYGCAIVLLLFPLFLLGQPATSSSTTGAGSAGGTLSQMRTTFGLSQAELGQIDPASETMKMATLGLRGVATNLLWTKANNYKRTESWDKLSATLNQIAKLQPNYITVWEYQAHNLSYNVSAEFDNYRHRYHWVKKGIEFLIEGTRYNRRNPRLIWSLGWFTGQKIGRADEHVQFRDMFRTDADFHDAMVDHINIDKARGPDGYPDNWLVANLWYLKSQAVVDKGIPITWMRIDPQSEGLTDKRRSPIVYYSDPSMALMNHSEAITAEITPGEKTRNAWKRAGQSWSDFGTMDIATSFGFSVRLSDLKTVVAEEKRLVASLDALDPGLRDRIREEIRAKIPEKLRKWIGSATAPVGLSPDERMKVRKAAASLRITDRQVAERVAESQKPQARSLVASIAETRSLLNRTENYRMIVNYPYWETRCDLEQSKEAADARRLMMLGDQAAQDGDPDEARKQFELAWIGWENIFEQYPELIRDAMSDDLMDPIMAYKMVLEQLDEEFPRDFKLNALLEARSNTEPTIEKFDSQSTDPPGDNAADGDDAPVEEKTEASPETETPPEKTDADRAESNDDQG